jgi:hypothetical protein
MTYGSGAGAEPVLLVKHADMEFILIYLDLQGCPAISVEAAGARRALPRPPPPGIPDPCRCGNHEREYRQARIEAFPRFSYNAD